MSANNYILIEEGKKGFKITQRDVETEQVLSEVVWEDTLRTALLKAKNLRDTEWFPVEYGIEIDLVESKKGTKTWKAKI